MNSILLVVLYWRLGTSGWFLITWTIICGDEISKQLGLFVVFYWTASLKNRRQEFRFVLFLRLLLGKDISIYWCSFFGVVSTNTLYNVYLLLRIWYVMYFYTYTHIWTSERPTAHIAGPSRYLNGLVWESGAGKPVCSSYEHIAPCLANCFLKPGSAD